MSQVGVGLIGSQFITSIHYESLERVAAADVRAVASKTEAHGRKFAEQRASPHWTND